MALKWLTPEEYVTGTVDICLSVPDDPIFWGILRAFFLDMCKTENWEYRGRGYQTEAETVSQAEALLASYEAKTAC